MAYPLGIRRLAIIKYNEGTSVSEIAQFLCVSIKVIYDWIKLYNETGDVIKRSKPIIIKLNLSQEILMKDIEDYPFLTQEERGKKFGISQSTMAYYFKKWGITYKKASQRGGQPTAESVSHYLEELGKIKDNKIMYLDESGIDRSTVLTHGYAKKGMPVFKINRGDKKNII